MIMYFLVPKSYTSLFVTRERHIFVTLLTLSFA